MSEVVDTDSGPKVEIKIEETPMSPTPALNLEGDAEVKQEATTEE